MDRLVRGRRAHKAFYGAVAAHTDSDRDFMTDSSVGGLFDGRPDLYESNGATWELKSTAYGSGPLYSAAKKQLGGYVGSFGSNGANTFGGSWSSLFGGKPSVKFGEFEFEPDTPDNTGLIFYSCKPPPAECSGGKLSPGLPRL